jgi:hypothetical protein
MGQTPDEIHENIATVRARMTETIRAISLTAEIRSRVEERIRSNAMRDARSADESLDRLPSDPLTGDSEADAETASEDSSETSGPVSPGAAARRNRALLAIIASATAGILAGLASMNHPPRAPREPGEEESRSLLK